MAVTLVLARGIVTRMGQDPASRLFRDPRGSVSAANRARPAKPGAPIQHPFTPKACIRATLVHMKALSRILREATRAIDAAYFQLSIAGGDSVYRERVYCYELYHQMRCLWPEECPFLLNGEVDKSGHALLTALGANGRKPDFLVHQPGNMNGNHAIIEVKRAEFDPEGFAKDLDTLKLFVNRVGYRRAIYLVYGDQADDQLAGRIQELAHSIEELPPIELWLHQRVGTAADRSPRAIGKESNDPTPGVLRRTRSVVK